MKISSLVDNYNFNDIKTKVKTDINNKKNKNEKKKSKNEGFQKLLIEIITVDFEFVCIAIEMKNIKCKYFDGNSELNILKRFDFNEFISKNENNIDRSFLIDIGLELEDLDIIDSCDIVGEYSEYVKLLRNIELFISDYNLLMNNIDYLLKKDKLYTEGINIENRLKLERRYIENLNKIIAFEKEVKNIVVQVNEISEILNIGINIYENKLIQIDIDKYEKFKKNDFIQTYETFIGLENFNIRILNEMNFVFEKYCKIFDIIFIDSTEILKPKYINLDVKKIKNQELKIKELISEMSKKEIILLTKLSSLKYSLGICENQMITLI